MLATTTAGLSLAGAWPWPAVMASVAARSETGRIMSRTRMTTWPSTWSSAQPAASALTTECMGMPKRRPAASTSRQGRTARVIGDVEAELGARPGLGVDLDPSPDRGQAGPDDVEPDPAARHL
jgi:hypothetical protein